MTIFIDNHTFGYEMQRLAQMFFPGERVTVAEGAPQGAEYLHTKMDGDRLEVTARLRQSDPSAGFTDEKPLTFALWERVTPDETSAVREHKLGEMLYDLLARATGIRPQWGVLTGIRPVKQFVSLLRAGADEPELRRHFIDERRMSEDRFALALRTAQAELPLLARSTPDSFSLYVSIPFCPTRCAYCSFVSQTVEKAARLIPEYVDRLCEELVDTAKLARELGLRLRTVYFGGGTPTVLSATQLSRVMGTIADHFDLRELWEYTIEAGRPDTIDADKLRAMKAAGVTRISVNPQTLSDEVLAAIGRAHTAQAARESFQLARELGFDNINMDLIAGLPADTSDGFRRSVDGVIALGAENVTVHTLTVKRAAQMTFARAQSELALVGGMVDAARTALMGMGYAPYYLYRQTGTLSSLENVGYAKPGREGLYNLYIMDETHTILAVGAGASTKLRHPVSGEIERIYNYKYPYEYLSRFETAALRKAHARAFYAGDGKRAEKIYNL